MVGESFGSEGFGRCVPSGYGNFDGSPGGTITINMLGLITGAGNGENNTQGGQYLNPVLTGIGAFSFGGQGVSNKTGDNDYAGTGGDGGTILVSNSGTISMSNTNYTPTYGIYAVSEGGEGSNYTNYEFGTSGDGGPVSVTDTGSILNNAAVAIASMRNPSAAYRMIPRYIITTMPITPAMAAP